jgi:hypothetical protein
MTTRRDARLQELLGRLPELQATLSRRVAALPGAATDAVRRSEHVLRTVREQESTERLVHSSRAALRNLGAAGGSLRKAASAGAAVAGETVQRLRQRS